MSRESIAIDLDDVLVAHAEAFIPFSNEHYGTNLIIDEYRDNWADIWHVGRDEIERRAAEFHSPENVVAFTVKEESREPLLKLSSVYDLFVVTARSKHLVDTTIRYVDQHFEGIFKGTHLVPIWEPGNKITKVDICKQIGAISLVDDLPRHCNLAAEGGIRAVLFGDFGWNRNEPIVDGVTKCRNWDEVLEYFGIAA